MPKRRRSVRLLSPADQVLTANEASEILRVSEPTLIRLVKRGDLYHIPGIRRILIPRASLDQLLQRALDTYSHVFGTMRRAAADAMDRAVGGQTQNGFLPTITRA